MNILRGVIAVRLETRSFQARVSRGRGDVVGGSAFRFGAVVLTAPDGPSHLTKLFPEV